MGSAIQKVMVPLMDGRSVGGEVVQWYGVGLTIKRSRDRFPARLQLHNDSGHVVSSHVPRCRQPSLLQYMVVKPGTFTYQVCQSSQPDARVFLLLHPETKHFSYYNKFSHFFTNEQITKTDSKWNAGINSALFAFDNDNNRCCF